MERPSNLNEFVHEFIKMDEMRNLVEYNNDLLNTFLDYAELPNTDEYSQEYKRDLVYYVGQLNHLLIGLNEFAEKESSDKIDRLLQC